MNPFSLAGKVVLVTGGAGRLGSAISEGCAEMGGSVVVTDTNAKGGTAVAKQLGPDCEFVEMDVTEGDDIRSTIDSIVDRLGTVDVLINSAYPRSDNYGAPFEDVTIEDWRRNIDLHLNSYYNVTREVVLQMIDQDVSGSIINMGSIYGVRAPDFKVYNGTDMTSPVEYSAIKGGILQLTRYLASYLGGDGIRVNALSPGGVISDSQPQRFIEQYEERTPLGRMASPDDVKGPAVFLASDASSYVTGHNLVIDGGWTIS